MYEIIFQEEDHKYFVDGKRKLSVTQIISSVGVKDDSGFYRSLTGSEFIKDDTASLFGRAFHKYPELYLNYVTPEYSPEMEPWIRGWHNWYDAVSDDLQTFDGLIETPMYCKAGDYAMTPDWVAVDRKGKVFVVDWKTSTAWQDHWSIQLAAYAKGIEENKKNLLHGRKVGAIIVRVFENGFEKQVFSPEKLVPSFNKFASINNVRKMAS